MTTRIPSVVWYWRASLAIKEIVEIGAGGSLVTRRLAQIQGAGARNGVDVWTARWTRSHTPCLCVAIPGWSQV
jgi:hypothetical protein